MRDSSETIRTWKGGVGIKNGNQAIEPLPMLPFGSAHGLVDEDILLIDSPALADGILARPLDLARGGASVLVAARIIGALPSVDCGDHRPFLLMETCWDSVWRLGLH